MKNVKKCINQYALAAKSAHYKALAGIGIDKETIRSTPIHTILVKIVYYTMNK